MESMGKWSLVPTVEFLCMLNLEHVILATIYISLLMLLQRDSTTNKQTIKSPVQSALTLRVIIYSLIPPTYKEWGFLLC